MCPLPQPRSQIDCTPSSFFTSSTNTRVSFSPDSPLPARSALHSNSVYVGAAIENFCVETNQTCGGVLPRILLRKFPACPAALHELVFITQRFGQSHGECILIDCRDPTRICRHDLSCQIHVRTDEHRHRVRQCFHHR